MKFEGELVFAGDEMEKSVPRKLHPGVGIGHVHLKVADLERALKFYRDVLGFEVTQKLGKEAAFLSAGGYHHHVRLCLKTPRGSCLRLTRPGGGAPPRRISVPIRLVVATCPDALSAAPDRAGSFEKEPGLNTWESGGGKAPAEGTTGLYHLAILYPTRAELADALRRVVEAGIPLEGASDHGVSEAIYLRDPDGNGVELYWDRPREKWPREGNGELVMYTKGLDLDALLREAPERT